MKPYELFGTLLARFYLFQREKEVNNTYEPGMQQTKTHWQKYEGPFSFQIVVHLPNGFVDFIA